MRPDLIVVGDVMVDVSVEAGSLASGGDVHGDVRLRPGGSRANAAVWAASEGARVQLFGRVGDDWAGRVVREALAERGVDARLAVDPEARTGTMLIVRQTGDRSMIADRGANARFSGEDLPPALEAEAVLVSAYLFFDPGSGPAARTALERASARCVAVDAASWPLIEMVGADRFRWETRGANLMFANEAEARVLVGKDAAEDMARELTIDYGAACIKRGAAGAVYAHMDSPPEVAMIDAPSPHIEEADPTGAGDAFDGTFLAARATGRRVRDALERACAAGARCAASPELWP